MYVKLELEKWLKFNGSVYLHRIYIDIIHVRAVIVIMRLASTGLTLKTVKDTTPEWENIQQTKKVKKEKKSKHTRSCAVVGMWICDVMPIRMYIIIELQRITRILYIWWCESNLRIKIKRKKLRSEKTAFNWNRNENNCLKLKCCNSLFTIRLAFFYC